MTVVIAALLLLAREESSDSRHGILIILFNQAATLPTCDVTVLVEKHPGHLSITRARVKVRKVDEPKQVIYENHKVQGKKSSRSVSDGSSPQSSSHTYVLQ